MSDRGPERRKDALMECGGLLPVIGAREKEDCLIDDTRTKWIDRHTLREWAQAGAATLAAAHKSLVLVLAANDAATVTALLSAAAADHVAMLVDPTSPAPILQRLFNLYRPDFVVQSSHGGTWQPHGAYELVSAGDILTVYKSRDDTDGDREIHPDLHLMLSTSGTTGSSKFVRLSSTAVAANARQIAKALRIGISDVAIGHLPTHYSYGLSVITSHLIVGAAVALINGGVTDRGLWDRVESVGGTHFPGVPFHYNVLARFGIDRTVPKSVQCFTQAGGKLDLRIQTRIHQQVLARDSQFYVMYGQTEAAPRMTTLPFEDFTQKIGSVGRALSDSRIRIVDDQGETLPAGQSGAIMYTGPNVMLGYAERRDDLSKPDELHQLLDTGDIGRLDEDGFLYIEGRVKRFAKLFGLRLGLDELEDRLSASCEAAAFDLGDKILLIHTGGTTEQFGEVLTSLALEYKIPRASFVSRPVEALPRRSSGKVDYAEARRLYEL